MTWPKACLSDLGLVVTGSTPKTSEASFYNGDIPFVTPAELDNGEPITTASRSLTESGAASARVVPQGAVMVSCIGSLGKVGIAGRPLVTNQQINSVVFSSDRIWPKYGFYACQLLRNQLEAMAPATTLPIVSKSKFEMLRIPVPPLDEQRRLAAILDQADDLRRKRRVALEKLNALPQAIFQEMFGDPIANPKGWPVCPLIDLVDRERPITYGILMPGKPLDQGVPYIRVVDMKNGGVYLTSVRMTSQEISDAYRRSLLRTDDLLLSIRGHVGRLASVPASLSGANITQDTARLALTGAHPLFVRECLRTAALQNWMKRHTKGGAVKGINLGDVKHIPVIAPPQEMQKEFAAAVSAYEAVYINQSESAGSLEILFASLQHRAFSGNLTSLSVEAMLAPV